jgi:uncharacterized membrane protein YgcG
VEGGQLWAACLGDQAEAPAALDPKHSNPAQVNPASAQQVDGSQLWALSTGDEGGSGLQGGGGEDGGGGGDQVCTASCTL